MTVNEMLSGFDLNKIIISITTTIKNVFINIFTLIKNIHPAIKIGFLILIIIIFTIIIILTWKKRKEWQNVVIN